MVCFFSVKVLKIKVKVLKFFLYFVLCVLPLVGQFLECQNQDKNVTNISINRFYCNNGSNNPMRLIVERLYASISLSKLGKLCKLCKLMNGSCTKKKTISAFELNFVNFVSVSISIIPIIPKLLKQA